MRIITLVVCMCAPLMASCGANDAQSDCHTFVRDDLEQLDERIKTEIGNGYRVVAMTQGEYQGIENAYTVLVCK